MKKIFTKKGRYENCLFLVAAFFIQIFGIYNIINNPEIEAISILVSSVFGIPLVIISFIAIVYIVYIFIRKIDDNKLYHLIKRIILVTMWTITFIILFDWLVLGIVRSFVIASSLTQKPTSVSHPLSVRLAYIFINNYSSILGGVGTTLWLSLIGTLIGLIIGLLFVSLRTLEVTSRDNEFVAFFKKIGLGFVRIYVTVFRGTPMMVQAIIIYYFLPGILSKMFSVEQTVFNSIFNVATAGLITVSLNTTAYLTEVLRGGIESINKGQMEAARSLGMTRNKAMITVIYPQTIKNSLPAICNEFIINIKDTSVLSVISVMDLFFAINLINGKAGNQDAIFIAAIIYLILTYSISRILGYFEKKMNLVAKPIPSSN